jgi:hypothetical protein
MPPTTMATNAAARAFTGGSAVGPRSGNRIDASGSGTRRS